MTIEKKSSPDELIACDICLKEVPVADAKNEEVSDYIIHFCGLECYALWVEKNKNTESEEND
ncbi:MAG: DUF3330 domain-containing protein [Gammaproteobacteria bacterium]